MDNQKLQDFLKSFYARVFEGSEFAGEGSIDGNIRNFVDNLLKDLEIYDEVSYIWSGGAKKSKYFTVTIGNGNYDELNEAKVKVKITLNKDKTISYGLSNDSGKSKGSKGFKDGNYKTVSIEQINYNDILDEMNKYKKDILEDINSGAVKLENNIRKMDSQTFANGFERIYAILKIFRTAKEDNGQIFVDELNKIDKSLLDKQIQYYSKDHEKVKKIRVDILKKLKTGDISLADVEKIKEDEKKNYDYNILKSRTNFSILCSIFYFYHKEFVNTFFTALNEELINDLGLKNDVDIKVIGFEGAQNFGLDGFWTAIYHNSHKSQKTALQLNIDGCKKTLGLDKVAIGVGHGPEYHGKVESMRENFDLKELTYEKILKEFQKYKDLILKDIYTEGIESANDVHYRLYAPGENAYKWDEYYESGYMGIGWDKLGDISKYKNRDDLKQHYIEVYGKDQNNNILACYQFAHEMEIGDVVIVKKGTKKFIGYGIVDSDYIYDDTREEYKSIRKVNRIKKGEWDVGKDSHIVVKTLTEISVKYPEYVEELKKLLGILPQSSVPMNTSKPTKDLNTILYGAPGTGKTYNTINYALSIIENKTLDEINKEDRSSLKERFDAYKEQGQIVFCTFHQSLSYEEFIEGIKANSDNGAISYDIGDGIFKSICKKAMVKSGSNIDEVIEQFKETCDEANGERITIETATTKFSVIYKGGKTFRFSPASTKNPDVDYPINIDNIKEVYTKEKSPKDIYNGTYSKGILDYLYKNFGLKEYNTLDDGGKNYVLIIDEINRGNMSKIFGELITLLEPSKRIGAEEELKVKLPYSQDEFGVPQNLYVIGTMNTADRSIALIDIALRRRFTFKEIEPNSGLLNFKVGNIDIQKMFETINERIEFLYDRDHKLGHSFFMPLKENNSLTKLNEIFYNNIIPLLQEYFYEDWEKIQIVLGDHAKQTNKKWEDRLIQEEIQSEAKIIGFNHEDIEDKVKYTVNNKPIEKSYLGIYSKTIDEKTE